MRLTLTLCLIILAAGLLGLGYGLYTGALRIPASWNPWAPISVAEPPNWLTRFKLSRLSDDDGRCQHVLAGAEMRYRPVPDRVTAPGCGFSNAVRIEATTAAVEEPFTLSCRAAVPLAIWERHVLQPAAREYFGHAVAELEHFGSYACRPVAGRDERRMSQHATADAIDIAGFILEDGRRIRVLSGWPTEDAEAEFLRDLHRGACRIFDGVLGPDYNPAHHDHMHFEQAGFRMCR
jgi:hypothetical protein